MNSEKLLSIVTINYNNLDGLNRTINSVISQSFRNFEYIIIDGGSTDGSKELIERFENSFFFWISEQDKGIYDAMNKGINVASGQWILFLNSGDCFFNENTLDSIFKNRRLNKYDVIYGSVAQIIKNEINEIKPSELCSFFYKMPFCHQSSLVKTSLLKNRRFDLQYKIAADYDLFCQMYREGKKFRIFNQSIAVFDDCGVSSTNKSQMLNEFAVISRVRFVGCFRIMMYICYKFHVLLRKLNEKR